MTRCAPSIVAGALSAWAAASSGCTFDAALPPGARVRCAAAADCVDGFACVATRCVARGSCGDGVLDPGEACDDGAGNADAPGACRTSCALPFCGDALVDPGEQCDDGNTIDDDACLTSCVANVCGDGFVDALREQCDDGNASSEDACLPTCVANVCGDGLKNPAAEQCDDGAVGGANPNLNPNDGCDACRATAWRPTVVVTGAVEGATALDVELIPSALALDREGRLLIADSLSSRVRRLEPDGSLSAVAGNGIGAFAGDGGRATSASLQFPESIAVDGLGRVVIADRGNARIRRVELDGTIRTVAGGGTESIDDVPAISTQFIEPIAVAVDGFGRIVIADAQDPRVRRVDSDGRIRTVAAGLQRPCALAFDNQGRLLIVDSLAATVVRLEVDGSLVTIVGGGTGFPNIGDGGPATSAVLLQPLAVAVDAAGAIYIADGSAARIRRVDSAGIIDTVGGIGLVSGESPDGLLATQTELVFPHAVLIDDGGRVVLSQVSTIRAFPLGGRVATLVGARAPPLDAGSATANHVAFLLDAVVAVDAGGRLHTGEGTLVRRVDPDGDIRRVAGSGTFPFNGDGLPAVDTSLGVVEAIAFDPLGRMLVGDRSNRIRRVELDGTMLTLAGTGTPGYTGDTGPAVDATLVAPAGLAVDAAGNVYFTDANNVVRRIDTGGVVDTFAGDGTFGFGGDGGPARQASFLTAQGLAVDALGRLVIVDAGNNRVRRVDLAGDIDTLAGDGTFGFQGDGGPARAAVFGGIAGVAADAQGNVFVLDQGNGRVRRIDASDKIDTIAGDGGTLSGGDGGPARAATFVLPEAVAADPAGRVFVGDYATAAVRAVELDGTILTAAGVVHPRSAGPFARASVLTANQAVSIGPDLAFATGVFGRILVAQRVPQRLVIAAGYDAGRRPDGGASAAFAPLGDVEGIAFDGVDTLYLAERSGSLHTIRAPDLADPSTWTTSPLTLGNVAFEAPAGLAFDALARVLYVVDAGSHCVIALHVDLETPDVVLGRCGTLGFSGDGGPPADARLFAPTHVTLGPGGDLYVADTGNQRVRLVRDGVVSTVIGDGSQSSAGTGAPARNFPIDNPAQMALDAFGNLFVASQATVRLIANVDGDRGADGDDLVLTIYGEAPRATYPESVTSCLSALVVVDDATVEVADACQGMLVELARVDQ